MIFEEEKPAEMRQPISLNVKFKGTTKLLKAIKSLNTVGNTLKDTASMMIKANELKVRYKGGSHPQAHKVISKTKFQKVEPKLLTPDMEYWNEDENFPEWSEVIHKANNEIFQNEEFRCPQKAIINCVLKKNDTFVIMPTGGGKSLIYQLTACIGSGITIVVFPLKSLMQDQVRILNFNKIKNRKWDGLTSKPKIQKEMDEVRAEYISNGSGEGDGGAQSIWRDNLKTRCLFLTPEKLNQNKEVKAFIKEFYELGQIERFVIDEVHCVDKWGHDFRKDYQELCKLRQNFPDVPILGLTATATEKMRTGIARTLGLIECYLFCSGFNRANLILEIRCKKFFTKTRDPLNIIKAKGDIGIDDIDKDSGENDGVNDNVSEVDEGEPEKNNHGKQIERKNILNMHIIAADMHTFINKKCKNKTGIVYCTKTAEVDYMVQTLNVLFPRKKHHNGKTYDYAVGYHGQMGDRKKERNFNRWTDDKSPIIVATVAFGMGIDKSTVRFVAHHNMPKSLENYYQEIGRAGRDGGRAYCIMYYDDADRTGQDFTIPNHEDMHGADNKSEAFPNMNVMQLYCENTYDCRRAFIIRHMGEDFEDWQCNYTCDNCFRKYQFLQRDKPSVESLKDQNYIERKMRGFTDERDLTGRAQEFLEKIGKLRGEFRMTRKQILNGLKGGLSDKEHKNTLGKLDLYGMMDREKTKKTKKSADEVVRFLINKLTELGCFCYEKFNTSYGGCIYQHLNRTKCNEVQEFVKEELAKNSKKDALKKQKREGKIELTDDQVKFMLLRGYFVYKNFAEKDLIDDKNSVSEFRHNKDVTMDQQSNSLVMIEKGEAEIVEDINEDLRERLYELRKQVYNEEKEIQRQFSETRQTHGDPDGDGAEICEKNQMKVAQSHLKSADKFICADAITRMIKKKPKGVDELTAQHTFPEYCHKYANRFINEIQNFLQGLPNSELDLLGKNSNNMASKRPSMYIDKIEPDAKQSETLNKNPMRKSDQMEEEDDKGDLDQQAEQHKANIDCLVEMGFLNRDQNLCGLTQAGGDINKAIDELEKMYR